MLGEGMQPGIARRSSKPLLHLHEKYDKQNYEAHDTMSAGLHLTAGVLNTVQL